MDKYDQALAFKLRHFCGTENWYKHDSGILYTDGVKYLTETLNCDWLLTEFGECVTEFKNEAFLSLFFVSVNDSILNVQITDGNKKVLGKRLYSMPNLVIDKNLPPEMALRFFLVFDQGLQKHVAMIASEY